MSTGFAFKDRTRGGQPTPCSRGANLDDLTVTDFLETLYKGKPHTKITYLSEGGYGKVYLLEFEGGVKFVMKQQDTEDEALENLKTAQGLRDCALVDFKSMNVDDHEIWTWMEVMEKDVDSMAFSRRKKDVCDYANFLRRTLQCLISHNASFTDMKPKNVAVKSCTPVDADNFRLIDLDGINGVVSSLPAIEKWAGDCSEPEEQMLQTKYSFAVCAMFFELKDQIDTFYYNNLAPLEERMRILHEHAATTKSPGVAMLIEDIDVPALERHWAKDMLPPSAYSRMYPS
jgi:hypothetical protein